ncbi:MAG: hypothetical protein HQL86_01985 [Magnetococcales bacterium]|nr:hypothetical protein [Magnetococcales bacterium]
MPDFHKAFQKTMGHEGGWCNTPGDRGGETYRGIARVYHPGWLGWWLIDAAKDKSGSPVLRGYGRMGELDAMVEAFYRTEFWERCGCDRIEHQAIAEEMFDSAVNCGVVAAQTWLQESINILNERFRLSGKLAVDGRVGPGTLAAVAKMLEHGVGLLLFRLMNLAQGAHYLALARKDPSQAKFLAGGWLDRVEWEASK